jgi:hypothetical protein
MITEGKLWICNPKQSRKLKLPAKAAKDWIVGASLQAVNDNNFKFKNLRQYLEESPEEI